MVGRDRRVKDMEGLRGHQGVKTKEGGTKGLGVVKTTPLPLGTVRDVTETPGTSGGIPTTQDTLLYPLVSFLLLTSGGGKSSEFTMRVTIHSVHTENCC